MLLVETSGFNFLLQLIVFFVLMMQDTSKNTYPYLFEAHKMFTAIYLKS